MPILGSQGNQHVLGLHESLFTLQVKSPIRAVDEAWH